MAARSNDLHETALSPAEHEAWMLWVESLSSEMGQTMSHEQLLHRIQETFADDRNSSQTRSPRQDREILGFLKNSGTRPTPGEALAMLRLVHHARLGGLLCRDHIFLQCPEPTHPREPAKSSNPFRSGASIQRPPPKRLEPPQRSPELRSTSNPPASGSLSAPANPFFRRVSEPSVQQSKGDSSTAGATSPGATTVVSSGGPPLPPRASKPISPPAPPPPLRAAPSTATLQGKQHSVSIISSSSERGRVAMGGAAAATHASAPVESHTMYGSDASEGAAAAAGGAGKKKRPPPAAPKPRLGLVSSTHISPETNMRPPAASHFDQHLAVSSSNAASRASSSSASIANDPPPPPPAEPPQAASSSNSTAQTTRPSTVARSQSLYAPVRPPPRRRPDLDPKPLVSPDSAPSPGDFRNHLKPVHQRANSLSQVGRHGGGSGVGLGTSYRSTVTPSGYNPRSLQQQQPQQQQPQRRDSTVASEFSARIGRVLAENEEFQRTSEWVQKATESIGDSIVARTGAPGEREGLLQQEHQQRQRPQATGDSSLSTSTSSDEDGLSVSGESLNRPNQHQQELARLRTQSEQGWTQL